MAAVNFVPPTGKLCHVYISHARETRQDLVHFLREAIASTSPALNVFLEEHPLPPSRGMRPTAQASLQDAFVVVVVLSKEYISSMDWLEELHLLLDGQRQGSPARLLPLYSSAPFSEVWDAVQAYSQGDARQQVAAKDLETVASLMGVARLEHAAGRAGTTQLVQVVARRVVDMLDDIGQFPRIKQLELPATLVGLDEQKEQVMQLLAGGNTAQRMVLLHGMAGIGKTTLAKAVFNQLQESNRTVPCSFLRLGAGIQPAGMVAKQQQLLMDLCNLDQDLKLESAEEGRRVLAQKLRGKRVLLQLDDAWDDQLEWLLPGSIMEVLGAGSAVLVTSRDLGSVRGFGQGVGVLGTEAMPAQQSLELFCWHAFGSNSVPASDKQWGKQIEEVVARCGGLPTALVAVGRHFRAFQGKRSAFFRKADAAMLHAFDSQKAQWKDDERTVFGALRSSWDALGQREQEDLLDIVWFLQGQHWDVVQVYCKFGVLDRLHDLAFVRKSANGEARVRVEVAPVVAQFCKAVAGTQRARRLELGGSARSARSSAASASLLPQDEATVGLSLHTLDLDDASIAALAQQAGLQVLRMQGVRLCTQLELRLRSMRWLELGGSLRLTSLHVQGMRQLSVVVLSSCAQLQQLHGLQECPALRALELLCCGQLREVNLEGLAMLRRLRLEDCEQLRVLGGMTGLVALQQLLLSDCGQLALGRADLLSLTALRSFSMSGCDRIEALVGQGFQVPTSQPLRNSGTHQSPTLADTEAAKQERGHQEGAGGDQQGGEPSCSDEAAQTPVSDTPQGFKGPGLLPSGKLCRVFVSYAGAQGLLAAMVKDGLEREYPALQGGVFMGTASLPVGSDLMDIIVRSLRDAFVVVLIISKEYVSSRSSMEKLHLLLEWQRQGSPARLLPVLYNITPRHLETMRTEYAASEAMWQQQGACDIQELAAITAIREDQVSSGWGGVMRDIVVPRTVELLRGMGQLPTASKLEGPAATVGLQAKVDQVMQRLAADGRSHIVLLYGAGGVGKSTLARAVFNQLHQGNTGMACHVLAMGPGTQSPSSIVQAQCRLLRHVCAVERAVVHSADEGRMVLSQNLEGKKVLLLLDDVWGASLSLLLPRRLAELLGRGSTVLVTSREAEAARRFDDGHGMLEVEVQQLSEQESTALFCTYAFGCTHPPAGEEDRARLVVARCGGLPMALEVVGRYLARVADHQEFWLQFEEAVQLAYGGEQAGRLESERTVFGAVAVSWDALDGEEKEALLDIVGVLRGQPWELVQAYCQYGVLRRLRELGLVTQLLEGDSTCSGTRVGMCRIIMDFCKFGVQGHQGRRLDLPGDLGEGESLTRFLAEAGDIRALRARHLPMHRGDDYIALLVPQLTSLRALHMAGCHGPAQMLLSLLNLRWLWLEGAPRLQELRIQGQLALRVVVLHGLHQLQTLEGLQECSSLRVLQINCKQLQWLDLEGLCDLEHLHLWGCRELLGIGGLEGLGGLEQVVIADCNQLERMGLMGLAALEQLRIRGCLKLQELEGLDGLDALEQLELADYHMQLAGVELLTSLTQLEVVRCPELQQLQLPSSLQRLRVEACHALTAIQCLAAARAAPSTSTNAHVAEQQTPGVPLAALRNVEVAACPALRPLPCALHLPAVDDCVYLFDGHEVVWVRGSGDLCVLRGVDPVAGAASSAAAAGGRAHAPRVDFGPGEGAAAAAGRELSGVDSLSIWSGQSGRLPHALSSEALEAVRANALSSPRRLQDQGLPASTQVRQLPEPTPATAVGEPKVEASVEESVSGLDSAAYGDGTKHAAPGVPAAVSDWLSDMSTSSIATHHGGSEPAWSIGRPQAFIGGGEMPQKVKLRDKLRKMFQFGGRGRGMIGRSTPSTGTHDGGDSEEVSMGETHRASPAKQHHSHVRPLPSPPVHPQPTAADTGMAPADSNDSGSANPTQSIHMQQAALQIQHSTTKQRLLQLEHVASMLKNGTSDQKVNAAELLFNLTYENDHVVDEVASLGVVQPLVTMIRAGNNKGRMFAAYTLSSLTGSDALRMEMQQQDAIPALVYVLAESSRPDLRKGAMRALGRLARCDDAACAMIVAAGGLPPMLSLLTNSDTSLVRRSLIALYFIGADKANLQQAIASAGAIPRLLALCDAESQEVQAEAVDVLKMLARNMQCGQQIAEAGGLEVLGQVALRGQGSQSGQSATRAIQRMYENPKLKEMMRHMNKGTAEQETDNEVQQLVDVAVAHGDPWIRAKAVKAIETDASDDPTASKELVDCGVVETLVDLLRSSIVSERINAARALGNLAIEPHARSRIVTAGAVPMLVAGVTQPDQGLQTVCLVTLDKVLEDPEAAACAAEERCVPAVLHLLAASMDPTLHHLCLRVMYLTCHSQGVAKSHLLEDGGVERLVCFCWRGDPELQRVAATILQDLAAHPTTHRRLITAGAVVALAMLFTSPVQSVADASTTALDRLNAAAERDVYAITEAEQQLQRQVSTMLERVREKVAVGAALEQAFRLVPRGAFNSKEQATHSAMYSDRSIVVAHLGISMIAPHLEALALEALQLAPGLSFLEAGSGSGFTTCLAACMLGSTGHALGVELKGGACDHARVCSTWVVATRLLQYCQRPEYLNMDILGVLPGTQRWDCILVSIACPKEVLIAMVGLLKPNGRLVAPYDGDLVLIRESSGFSGIQILARNVPYRSMTLPSQPLLLQPALPLPHPVGASSDNKFGSNTSSPAAGAALPALPAGSERPPASRIPSSQAKQMSPEPAPSLDRHTTEQRLLMGVNMMEWSDIDICRNVDGRKCRLGEGEYMVVYRALINKVDEAAVKVVKQNKPTPKEREVFIKEVTILARLHHRNIVQFYGACLGPGSMFIATELMKGGDLYSALRNHSETMRWENLGKKVALDVALATNYLHSHRPPLMHRDLKSPNVLLSEEGVAKVFDVDMVLLQVKALATAQAVMTSLWAAPEVMRYERASIKADIWSYGILIWELVSGEDITDYQPLAVSMQMGSKAGDGKVMTLPPKCPPVAQLLFQQCCQQDPERRPTAQQLVEWLRKDHGD